MNYEYTEWKHVFKVDPNKEISDEALEALCESGTDAIIIGGSDGVTLDNTINLLARIRRYSVPCVLEISNLESITPGYDFYFIPSVLNSKDPKWIINFHHQAVKEYGDVMNWDEIVVEGYCILNPESKAAVVAEATDPLTVDDVIAYARLTERMFRMPIFYIEYSGIYGDPQLLKEVKRTLSTTKLFYGGGITSLAQAEEMAAIADTIVVGNIIYDDLKEALKTVHAVR